MVMHIYPRSPRVSKPAAALIPALDVLWPEPDRDAVGKFYIFEP